MKIQIVHQHDEQDCSAACLSSIARSYGLKVSLAECRQRIRVDNDGASMYALVQGAREFGLEAINQQGTWDDLMACICTNRIPLPFIARIINQEQCEHYVVVYRITKRGVVLGDPSKGKVSCTHETFQSMWTGHITSIRPGMDFRPEDRTRGSVWKFVRMIAREKSLIAGVILISLAISGISLAGSVLFEYTVNSFVYEGKNTSTAMQLVQSLVSGLDTLCVCLIGLYLFQGVVQVLRSYLLASLTRRIDTPLTMDFFNHLIHLPISFFCVRKNGEILSRFADISNIREAISGTIMTLIIDSTMVLFFGIYLFSISPVLFLITVMIIAFYGIVVLAFKPMIKHYNLISTEKNAEITSYLNESIDGIETIKAFGNEDNVFAKADTLFRRLMNIMLSGTVVCSVKDALIAAISSIGVVALLWTGNRLCQEGVITLGSIVSFYVVMSYFLSPLQNLIELQPVIQTGIVAADRLNDILEIPTETAPTADGEQTDLKGDISFENITFRYGYRQPVIEDLSVRIPAGTKVAIVGESGSGKTTLMRLLMGFYEPETGSILVNGRSLSQIDPKTLRSRIAYISQESFFFSDTICNNLRMGNEALTDEEVKNACVMACADEFIRRSPQGYDTILAENGANLSGGQRQRLSIARALLRKPDIMILDEATSNLDTITENSIKNTIFHAASDLTTFIIAHRLSTVKNCDLILVIENGRILEYGTHEELMKKGKTYSAYWNVNS